MNVYTECYGKVDTEHVYVQYRKSWLQKSKFRLKVMTCTSQYFRHMYSAQAVSLHL